MKVFKVGGCVRDALMGRPSRDVDYVVVGGSAEALLAQGFKQVGADFPVFLHPETGEEYALARTERKTRPGYYGFETRTEGVSLEEDLWRRDLTINAMALDAQGSLADPFGGKADLEARVLRHVSEAFKEDPVRVLRIARFLARYGDTWRVAPETAAMVRGMLQAGELDALVPERVWAEVEKGLEEPYPWLMFQFLSDYGILAAKPFFDYQGYCARKSPQALKEAVRKTSSIAVRFAAGFARQWDSKEAVKSSRLPSGVRDIAQKTAELTEKGVLHFETLPSEDKLRLLEQAGAFQNSQSGAHKFEQVVLALRCREGDSIATALTQATARTSQASATALVAQGLMGSAISARLRQDRLALLQG